MTAGRLPPVAGVREISMEDLEFGEKIGQGGFSVIHKGYLNGTPVAIKKAILRHPNIALLMGVMPKIPNIVIVFEHVA